MIEHYGIKPGDRILDVGCGKGFLAYDFTQEMPGVDVVGLDVSEYALENAKEEIKDKLVLGNAVSLPFEDDSFDFVVSITTLHNLPPEQAVQGLGEIERVSRGGKFVCVESYRTEEEKVNLLYWQLTCECFARPDTWGWYFKQAGYTGDHCFIYF